MDCSNMVTYMLEEKRMCDWHYENFGCTGCPLGIPNSNRCSKLFNNQNCISSMTKGHLEYMIKKVQKWSDEHKA